MSLHEDYYRRADVLDRWANIYGGKRAAADLYRFEAARLRFVAELHVAIEPAASWVLQRILASSPMRRMR